MCVAVKKKLQLYYWKDREFYELEVNYSCNSVSSRGHLTHQAINVCLLLSFRGILQLQIFQNLWLGVKTPYVLVSNETITSFGYMLQKMMACFICASSGAFHSSKLIYNHVYSN